jgi:hypothetical protein
MKGTGGAHQRRYDVEGRSSALGDPLGYIMSGSNGDEIWIHRWFEPWAAVTPFLARWQVFPHVLYPLGF